MSEISARASRLALREGSWDRNGLVGRPPAAGVGAGRGADGALATGAAGRGGADATGAAGEGGAVGGRTGTAGPGGATGLAGVAAPAPVAVGEAGRDGNPAGR